MKKKASSNAWPLSVERIKIKSRQPQSWMRLHASWADKEDQILNYFLGAAEGGM